MFTNLWCLLNAVQSLRCSPQHSPHPFMSEASQVLLAPGRVKSPPLGGVSIPRIFINLIILRSIWSSFKVLLQAKSQVVALRSQSSSVPHLSTKNAGNPLGDQHCGSSDLKVGQLARNLSTCHSTLRLVVRGYKLCISKSKVIEVVQDFFHPP